MEAVAGEDFLDQRQADALAVRLGAEERREEVRLRLGGRCRGPSPRSSASCGLPPDVEPDGDRAVAVDGLDRVLEDVQQRLLDLAAIDRRPRSPAPDRAPSAR